MFSWIEFPFYRYIDAGEPHVCCEITTRGRQHRREHVIDRDGGTVGQGRGVAELREPGMNNANKTVKMALKRAQVDAVLRCAGLSQWFTQDLEEPPFVAPEIDPNRATPMQCQDIRIWLKMTGKTEDEILTFYGVGKLEELTSIVADKILRRLMEMGRRRA